MNIEAFVANELNPEAHILTSRVKFHDADASSLAQARGEAHGWLSGLCAWGAHQPTIARPCVAAAPCSGPRSAPYLS